MGYRKERCNVTSDIYLISAPTRTEVLFNLTRMENEEQDPVAPIELTAAAVWVNDGLEIEEMQ